MKFALLRAGALALLLALPGLVPRALAQVAGAPAYVDYQGVAYDSSNKPLGSTLVSGNYVAAPTNYVMQFRIYDAQSAGHLIYAETQTVTASLGAFSVRLGAGAPISGVTVDPVLGVASIANAFNGKDRYLELTVVVPPASTGTPITPRLAFQASPFSFVAQHAALADSLLGTVSAGSSITGTAGAPVIITGTITATGATVSNGTFKNVTLDSAISAATATVSGGTFSNGTFSNGTFAGTFSGTGSGTFTGTGTGLTALNASNLASGTVADTLLTTNVDLLYKVQTISGAKTFTANPVISKANSELVLADATGTVFGELGVEGGAHFSSAAATGAFLLRTANTGSEHDRERGQAEVGYDGTADAGCDRFRR